VIQPAKEALGKVCSFLSSGCLSVLVIIGVFFRTIQQALIPRNNSFLIPQYPLSHREDSPALFLHLFPNVSQEMQDQLISRRRKIDSFLSDEHPRYYFLNCVGKHIKTREY
jgi:hypothetical protein